MSQMETEPTLEAAGVPEQSEQINRSRVPKLVLVDVVREPEVDDDPMAWKQKGACKDIDVKTFFPSNSYGVDVARAICRDCVIQEECLEFALTTKQDHGVWGGESERQRRRILRQRYRAAQQQG